MGGKPRIRSRQREKRWGATAALLATIVLLTGLVPTSAGADQTVTFDVIPDDPALIEGQPKLLNDRGTMIVEAVVPCIDLVYDPATRQLSYLNVEGHAVGVFALNERDEIAARTCDGTLYGFTINLRTGALTTFPGPGGQRSLAVDINEHGVVVGDYEGTDQAVDGTAFYWRPGDAAPTLIPGLGGGVIAQHINDQDQVVLASTNPGGTWDGLVFDIATGTARTLPLGQDFLPYLQINDAGMVIAAFNDGTGAYWLPNETTSHTIPGRPIGVSDAGTILQQRLVSGSYLFELLDTTNGQTTSVPGATGLQGAFINHAGQVAGTIVAADGSNHPFRYDPATGPLDLGLPAGYAGGYTTAFNQRGQLAGPLTNASLARDGQFVATITSTPSTTSTTSTTVANGPGATTTGTPAVVAVPRFTG